MFGGFAQEDEYNAKLPAQDNRSVIGIFSKLIPTYHKHLAFGLHSI